MRYGRRSGTGTSAKETMTRTREEGFGPEVIHDNNISIVDIN